MMNLSKINYWSVIAAAILVQVFAAIWYTVFGEKWMLLHGLTAADAAKESPLMYVHSLLVSILQGFLMAQIFKKANIADWKSGLIWGLLIGGVFVMLDQSVVNVFAMKDSALTMIDGGHALFGFGLMGLILGVWQKKES